VPIGYPEDFVLRFGGYIDALTVVSGRDNRDAIDVSAGVQSLILGHLILEVTGGYRVFGALARELRFRDTGGVEANVGARIDF
jgi:hypothetical protein